MPSWLACATPPRRVFTLRLCQHLVCRNPGASPRVARFGNRANDEGDDTKRAVIPRHRVSPSASPMTGSSGVSSTPRLLDSITGVSGILGRPVKPGDDGWGCGAFIRNEIVTDSIFQTANKRYDFAISRRDVPEFCKNCFASPWNRGRGECRVPNAPAASRVIKNKHTS